MLAFVILANVLLTLLNCYIAFRLYRLRRTLIRVRVTLTRVEQRIHRIFASAPAFVFKGQQGTHSLHQSYQRLAFQLAGLQQSLMTVALIFRLCQSQRRRYR